MAKEIIREGLGIVIFRDTEKDTYSYMLDGTILMNDLPSLCKPMMIKSYEELLKIRKKEIENGTRNT